MKDLHVRLAALDPEADAAVKVIAYFDELTGARVGLRAIVRGAAVLSGCPARLTDERRRLFLRVEPDGRPGEPADPPDPSWLSTRIDLEADGGALLWLERLGPAGPVEAMVLERAAMAARAVLDRTRGAVPSRPDAAAVEVLIDASAPPEARRHAGRALGLADVGPLRAIAPADGGARIEPAAGVGSASGGPRAGVGPAVDVLGLPASWAAARTALRLTAEGTADDPGPRVVRADELGGLLVLAGSVGPETAPIADEPALEHAAVAAPWMLATLHAVATSASLRAAADSVRVHHSTLQDRIVQAERLLGWSIRQPEGCHRLYLALALRRLRRRIPDG